MDSMLKAQLITLPPVRIDAVAHLPLGEGVDSALRCWCEWPWVDQCAGISNASRDGNLLGTTSGSSWADDQYEIHRSGPQLQKHFRRWHGRMVSSWCVLERVVSTSRS